jgi:hypothetical protein
VCAKLFVVSNISKRLRRLNHESKGTFNHAEVKMKRDTDNPGAGGHPRTGSNGSESNNGHENSANANQGQATPSHDSWKWRVWGRYVEHRPKWEHVDYGIARTSQGHTTITVWRLAVPGGHLYKTTEWDESGHYTVQVCFVSETKQ